MAQQQGVSRLSTEYADDLFRCAVLVKIIDVHDHRMLRAGPETGIQAVVANDKIGVAVAIKVSAFNAVPPACRSAQPDLLGDIGELTPIIAQHFDGHPFAHNDQIGVFVAIKIAPDGVFDHAQFLQHRSDLGTDVPKISPPIVVEDIAIHGYPVHQGGKTHAYKKIEVTILVVIRRIYTGSRFKVKSG